MQFRVGPAHARDPMPPEYLKLLDIAQLPATEITRPLDLLEDISMDFEDAPAETLLGTVRNGMPEHRMRIERVTENGCRRYRDLGVP
jgi:hypothetical protein